MSDFVIVRRSLKASVVCALLDVDRSTIKRMIDDGRLDGFKLGKLYRVYVDSIKKYQEDNRFVADGIQ